MTTPQTTRCSTYRNPAAVKAAFAATRDAERDAQYAANLAASHLEGRTFRVQFVSVNGTSVREAPFTPSTLEILSTDAPWRPL